MIKYFLIFFICSVFLGCVRISQNTVSNEADPLNSELVYYNKIEEFQSIPKFVKYFHGGPEDLVYFEWKSPSFKARARKIPAPYLAVIGGELFGKEVTQNEWNEIYPAYEQIVRFEIEISNYRISDSKLMPGVNDENASDHDPIKARPDDLNHYLNYEVWKDLFVVCELDTIQAIHSVRVPGFEDKLKILADFTYENSEHAPVKALMWRSKYERLPEFVFIKDTDQNPVYKFILP